MFYTNLNHWSAKPVSLLPCGRPTTEMITVQLNHKNLLCPVLETHGNWFAIVPELELREHAHAQAQAQG